MCFLHLVMGMNGYLTLRASVKTKQENVCEMPHIESGILQVFNKHWLLELQLETKHHNKRHAGKRKQCENDGKTGLSSFQGDSLK